MTLAQATDRVRQNGPVQLEQVDVENFRAFEAATLELPGRGVVVIAGANNSGKSALLSAFDVLTGFASSIPAARRHGSTSVPTVRAHFVLDESTRRQLLVGGDDIENKLVTPALSRLQFVFRENDDSPDHFFLSEIHGVDPRGEPVVLGQVLKADPSTWSARGVGLASWAREPASWRDFPAPAGISASSAGPADLMWSNGELNNVRELFQNWQKSYFHLSPHRGRSDRTTRTRTSAMLDATGANLTEALYDWSANRHREWTKLKLAVSELAPGTGDLHIGALDEDSEVRFQLSDDHRANLKDLGTGIEQMLQIVYAGVRPPSGSLTVLEEPESNLHPGAQRVLAGLLDSWASDRLFVIATHSPAFIDDQAGQRAVWLTRKHGDDPASLSRVDSTLTDVAGELGIQFSDVLVAQRLIVTEGPSDAAILTAWFPDIAHSLGTAIVAGHASGMIAKHVGKFHDWLERSNMSDTRLLYVRDRDELSDHTIEQLRGSGVVHVLHRREIENYLLDPVALIEHLRTLGVVVDMSVETIDSLISAAAVELRPKVVLKRVRDSGQLLRGLDRDRIATFASSDDPCAELIAYVLELPQPSEESIRALWDAEDERLSETWDAVARDVAPGEEILTSVFRHFGRAFDKIRDGPRIAALIEPPEELVNVIHDFTSS